MEITIHFSLSFDQSWLISQRGNDVLPVDKAVDILKSKFDIDHLKTRIDGCEGSLELDLGESKDEFVKELADILKTELNVAPDVFSISAKEVEKTEENSAPDKKSSESTAQKEQKKSESVSTPDKTEEPVKTSAFDSIMGLVGADEFKALVRECRDSAESFIQNDLLDVFRSRSYIFSVSDGYGLSTYLKLFAGFLEETGLYDFPSGRAFSTGKDKKYIEVKLGAPNKDDCFASASCHFEGNPSGKIICIDISEWMQKLSSPEFRGFLKAIDSSEAGHIVIFRVPFIEKNVLSDVEYIISDILHVRSVSIPPFSSDELVRCAQNVLDKKNYSFDDEAWGIFRSMIAAEKSDGRFYGINTVHKVLNEILYTKITSGNGAAEKTVTGSEIRCLSDGLDTEEINVKECLDGLIGMEDVKARLMEIVSQIETARANPALGKPSMHIRFLGNPGTGKTTIARILGQILKEKKILRNGGFIEVQGRDLCGRYIGETAPKTAGICREAYGSVLFIDEAYSLYVEDSPRDYGKEAITTLLAEMENHRDDMVVIMAGYSEEMSTLLRANPGFASRMPYTIEFPNYKKEDLAKIFMELVKKSFTYSEEFENSVKDYFDGLTEEVLNAKNFSNVRFVRNLFERTWGKAAMRCQMEGTECNELTESDFRLASADKEFAVKTQEKKRRIGF